MNTAKHIESQIESTKETLEALKAELHAIMQSLAQNEINLESCDDESRIDALIDQIAELNASLNREKVKVRLRQRQNLAKLEALEADLVLTAKREQEQLASAYCETIEKLVEQYTTASQQVMDLTFEIKKVLSEARVKTSLGFSPDSVANPKIFTIEGTLSKDSVGYTTGSEIAAGVKPTTEEELRYEFINVSLIKAEGN